MITSCSISFRIFRTSKTSKLKFAVLPAVLFLSVSAIAQNSAYLAANTAAPIVAKSADASSGTLPEDPGTHLNAFSSSNAGAPEPQMQLTPQSATKAGPFAPEYSMTISAGFNAQPWTARDKFIGGARDLYAPASLLGIVFSAGYSHVTNGQPNYGVDKGAFGQRLGATAIRDSTETFLSESVLAPIFHEDPRYYVEGPRYNLFHRTLYSITRPLITRSDSGKNTVNAAVLIGYAAGSASSYAYYPAINQNFKDTAATYGGSLAGAAIGDFVSEFTDDVFQALHLEKKR
jgi:hypothetical protein